MLFWEKEHKKTGALLYFFTHIHHHRNELQGNNAAHSIFFCLLALIQHVGLMTILRIYRKIFPYISKLCFSFFPVCMRCGSVILTHWAWLCVWMCVQRGVCVVHNVYNGLALQNDSNVTLERFAWVLSLAGQDISESYHWHYTKYSLLAHWLLT